MDFENIINQQLDQVLQGENIQGISDEAYRLSEGLSDPFTIENILNATLEGESIFQTEYLIENMKDLLLYEVQAALILCVEILSIIMITGLLKSLTDGVGSKSVSQLSLMVCTMVIIGISLNSFRISWQLASDCISSMAYTMGILMPVLIGILLATGSVTSGTVLSPVIIGAVTGFAFLVKTFILPAFFVSTVLSLINCLTEKSYANKLAKLIRSAALFLTGLIITILGGIVTVQGLLTESADGLLINAAKYSLSSFIPIVGGFTSDTAELFLRCMGSIKSVVGVFGLVTLTLMMAVPLLKIAAVGAVYKVTSALAEPVTDTKIADGLNDMGNTMISMASILFFVSLLFILFITTIMGIGGGG